MFHPRENHDEKCPSEAGVPGLGPPVLVGSEILDERDTSVLGIGQSEVLKSGFQI